MVKLDGFSELERIAEGGMAVLYRGIQTSLNRPVAIKVLKSALHGTPEAREMFELESQIVARLDHPNIIRVIDKGLTEDEAPYFVMDYVEGMTLKQALQKGLPDRGKLRLIMQVAKALAYAHKNNIIHRDIKPGNILIDQEGNARVVDFGIARLFSEDTDIKQRSEAGMTVGTMSYMAPEQRLGAEHTSELSDIYSLGVIMYSMFANKLYQSGFPPLRQLNPRVPERLENIVTRCLSESPADRPNAAQLIEKLLKSFKGAHLNKQQKQTAKASFSDPKEKFRLLDIIKETEFSTVMLYENRADKSLMVLKKTIDDFNGYNEAKLLSRLKHPNIINIRGASRNERIFLLVMEHLAGGDLQARMACPMSLENFKDFATQICSALAFAHNNRIVHGNLRPQNILFDANNRAIVTDFGLPAHYGEEKTINWYQPKKEAVTALTDIYAAGVIFYQLLTGQIPKRNRDKTLAKENAFDELPKDLQHLLSKMLELNPQQRTQRFEEVLSQLTNFQPDIKKAPPNINKTPGTAAQKQPEKHSKLTWVLIILLLTLVINTLALTWFGYQKGWLDDYPKFKQFISHLTPSG